MDQIPYMNGKPRRETVHRPKISLETSRELRDFYVAKELFHRHNLGISEVAQADIKNQEPQGSEELEKLCDEVMARPYRRKRQPDNEMKKATRKNVQSRAQEIRKASEKLSAKYNDQAPRCSSPLRKIFSPSPLEQLPSELIEPIFLHSLNGNLIRASRIIASKLQSPLFRRGIFIIAFCQEHLPELRKVLHLGDVLDSVILPIRAWDLRSIVKVVLDSKWCTVGFFKKIAYELQDYACNLYLTRLGSDQANISIALFKAFRDDGADVIALVRQILFETSHRRLLQFNLNPFCLSFICNRQVDPMTDEYGQTGQDASHPHIRIDDLVEEGTFWKIEPKVFGTIPLNWSSLKNEDDADPFKALVMPSFQKYNFASFEDKFMDAFGYRNRLVTWDALIADFHRAQRIAQDPGCPQMEPLRRLVQLDYFFSPEDAAYKIPQHVFAQMICACRLSFEDRHLSFMFQIDPRSFPTTVLGADTHIAFKKFTRRAHQVKER
jgi:hypothetical protein